SQAEADPTGLGAGGGPHLFGPAPDRVAVATDIVAALLVAPAAGGQRLDLLFDAWRVAEHTGGAVHFGVTHVGPREGEDARAGIESDDRARRMAQDGLRFAGCRVGGGERVQALVVAVADE